ncbi:MAG: glycosyltransferase [bacterium]
MKEPNRPLKVARIISGLWPGGVEKKLTTLLPLLDKSRFEARVVCLKSAGELAPELVQKGIPVIEKPISSRWSPKGLWKLGKYLKEQKIDIVHTHMYRANISGTVAAKIAGTPVIVANIHTIEGWDDAGQIFTDRIVSRFRHCTVFVSESVRQNYIERISLPESRQKVIYNGVDTRFFCPGKDDDTPIFDGNLKVGCAARLMPIKALHVLVEAAADPDFQNAGVHFYIAGDGPLRQELLEYAQSVGALDFFHLLGFTNDTRDFYRALDIFVMPSLKEGFSNALIEAMACGLPIVTTAVGGNPEAIRHEINGLLVPPSDSKAFIEALRTIVNNPETRLRMGRESLRIAQSFSMEEMVRRTENFYIDLWQKSGVEKAYK